MIAPTKKWHLSEPSQEYVHIFKRSVAHLLADNPMKMLSRLYYDCILDYLGKPNRIGDACSNQKMTPVRAIAKKRACIQRSVAHLLADNPMKMALR